VDRFVEGAAVLPNDTVRDHAYLKSRAATRLVFIQKVRNGTFLGYGGIMPPFSKEVMSDADLSALLGFLELSD
jgi:thiosulfate dehydrogenase